MILRNGSSNNFYSRNSIASTYFSNYKSMVLTVCVLHLTETYQLVYSSAGAKPKDKSKLNWLNCGSFMDKKINIINVIKK